MTETQNRKRDTHTTPHDDDLFTLAGIYHVLPIHERTAYGWTMPPPDAEIEIDGRQQQMWKASTLRDLWYHRQRHYGERSTRWRHDAIRSALDNVTEGAPPPGVDGHWIRGAVEGTRELIVRYIDIPTA